MNESAKSATRAEFREGLSRFASGVVVVTAVTPSGPIGVTASAFTSVSLDPPLILVCLAQTSSVRAGLTAAPFFGVSVLARRQAWIADQFAQRGIDRFAGVPLDGALRAPLIEGALARLECAHHAVHEAGDHLVLLGRVVDVGVDEGRPLVHYARRYGGFVTDATAAPSDAVPLQSTRLEGDSR